jgi:hypothetical protein
MKKASPPFAPNPTMKKGKPVPTISPAKKGGSQKDSPKLEKLEEKYHTDFDHDDEKGESPKHAKKVRSGKPLPVTNKKDKAEVKKLCGACKKAGKSSCSHM